MRQDAIAGGEALALPNYLLVLGEGRVPCDNGDRATIPSSVNME